MRIGYFYTGRHLAECPPSLERFAYNKRWYCRQSVDVNCSSVYFDSLGNEIKEVCGMIVAYQWNTPDAFHASSGQTIDDPYMDGISITQGFPRQHIWTYAVGAYENTGGHCITCKCPCSSGGNGNTSPPSFVGGDYYCDSGNTKPYAEPVVYPDRLWDSSGVSCVSGSTCCDNPDQPWFRKKLTTPSTDNIEVRWCGNSAKTGEAAATTQVEVYVQI